MVDIKTELKEGENAKQCSSAAGCGELKGFDEFYKSKDGKYGLTNKCKKCIADYQKQNKDKIAKYKESYYANNQKYFEDKRREWRTNNKEKMAEYHEEFIKNNPDKIKAYNHKRRAKRKLNGGSYTQEQWEKCLLYFNGCCAYSGILLCGNIHVEHIIPISKGGTSYIWNIVPSLSSVNMSKRNKDMEKWYKKQEYFSEERLQKIYRYIETMKENCYEENIG